MRSHRQSRGAAAFVCAAVFSFVLAACSGGGGSGSGSPVPPAAPVTPTSAKSISFASAGTAQALPQVGGISSSIVLPQNNAPSGAELDVAVSTSPTQTTPQIPAGKPQAFVYFAMTPSADVTLNGSPKVSVTLPSAPSTQGQFYAWLYDTTTKSWLDLAPVTVQGTQITFGGTSKTLTLKRGVQYLAIPFTAAANVSCPTPIPSPTPTPTPPPISGKFYLGAAGIASSGYPFTNATLLTYDEGTGAELASLPLGYPQGAEAQTISLSSDFSKLYIGAEGPIVNDNVSTLPIPGLTIVDSATNTIVHQTTINGGISAGALSPDGTRYYGAGENGNNALFVFDATTGALLNTITLPPRNPAGLAVPQGIVVTPTTAYVVSGDGDAIWAVNLSTNAVSTFFSCTKGCSSVGVDQTNTKIFVNEISDFRVLTTNGSTIAVINPPPGTSQFLGGAGESADRSAIGVQEQLTATAPNGNAEFGASIISTSSNAVSTPFRVPIPAGNGPVLNTTGVFALFFQPANSGYPGVDARALPLGQLYYSVTPPSQMLPTSAAAQ